MRYCTYELMEKEAFAVLKLKSLVKIVAEWRVEKSSLYFQHGYHVTCSGDSGSPLVKILKYNFVNDQHEYLQERDCFP